MPHTIHLTDCSEMRQTLLAQPPWIVRVTTVLLLSLTVAAVIWAAWTPAEVVVRAQGRVRPVDALTRVFTPSDVDFDGRVQQVYFREGSHVTAGQSLLQLDTQRLAIQIAEASARIDAAQQEVAALQKRMALLDARRTAEVAKLEVEAQEAEQRLEQARLDRQSKIRHSEVEVQRAHENYERHQTLVASKVVSSQAVEVAHAEWAQAQRDYENALLPLDDGPLNVLRAARAAIEKEYALRYAELEHDQVRKQGEIAVARKLLEKLELQRSRQHLTAPIDGVIVSSNILPGDVVTQGTAVIEIAPHDRILFEANLPSEQLGGLQLGMDVKLKLDAFDFQQYGTLPGRISFIAPDSHVPHEDGLAPRALYKVQVELLDTAVGHAQQRADIKLGMGATAEIVTERHTLLQVLLKKIRGSISLG